MAINVKILLYSHVCVTKVKKMQSFEKFRRLKLHSRKSFLAQQNRKKQNCSALKNKNLRKLWIKTLKKYLGIPYHQRWAGQDFPDYDGDLFLDCCGLLRKVSFFLGKSI